VRDHVRERLSVGEGPGAKENPRWESLAPLFFAENFGGFKSASAYLMGLKFGILRIQFQPLQPVIPLF